MSGTTDIRVVIIEPPARAGASLAVRIAGAEGFSVAGRFDTVDGALGRLDLHSPDVALLLVSGAEDSRASVRRLADRYPALPILVLSPEVAETEAVEAIRAGAGGYLPQDTQPARLRDAIRELRDGGAPMTPTVAGALVRSIQAPAPSPSVRPSAREIDTLRLLSTGHSYKTAAVQLGVSVDTIRFHVRNVYAKLHVHSKVEAVLRATREGLIP